MQGLGFAAIRDFVSFARHSPVDDAGTSNPLFVNGRPVLTAAIAMGLSQSGRLMRDLLYQGFNQDTAGRKVFDAMTGVVVGPRDVYELSVCTARPLYASAEDRFYPTSGFPFTFESTHRSPERQDRWTFSQVLGVEHVPQRDSGGSLYRIVRRSRFAHRHGYEEKTSPALPRTSGFTFCRSLISRVMKVAWTEPTPCRRILITERLFRRPCAGCMTEFQRP